MCRVSQKQSQFALTKLQPPAIKKSQNSKSLHYNKHTTISQNISKQPMKKINPLITILLLVHLLHNADCVRFISEIPGLERQCYYEVLTQYQKYSLELVPQTEPKYELEIAESRGGSWTNIFYKMTHIGYEKVQVHKLASMSTTYSICVKNLQNGILRLSIKFQTGVQLMQFELLPDKSDTENLDRQISWIESQKKNLYETIRKVEQRKTDNMDSSALLSTKMIIFAVLGLFSIVGVNYLFFREVKKTFKERKLM